MPNHFTFDDLIEIMRTSIGIDDGVRLDGDQADVDFAAIGYDSLALIELASQIQRQYGIRISDEDALEKLRSPREAVAYVDGQLATQAA
jgi:act minimal PKS acyl carrier protein